MPGKHVPHLVPVLQGSTRQQGQQESAAAVQAVAQQEAARRQRCEQRAQRLRCAAAQSHLLYVRPATTTSVFRCLSSPNGLV